MRLMWGRRAEKKSNFFVTVIFVLAVIGAVMSSGSYEFGEEAMTGNAVASAGSSEINFGFFGLLLALVALIGLVILGFFALSSDRQNVMAAPAGPKKTCLPEFAKIDREIDSLSRRLDEIDISLGNK